MRLRLATGISLRSDGERWREGGERDVNGLLCAKFAFLFVH